MTDLPGVAGATTDDQGPVVAAGSEASSIGRRAGRGLRWALGGNLVLKVGSFALSLAMVRLIAPHDFGLYAVALAANAFLIHVNDMGMIAATAQWHGRVEEMAASATTVAIAFSLAWYGLAWFGAPLLADAAGSPGAVPLVRLLTLTVVIDGVTAVSVGVIQRRFQQDALMKAIAAGFVCCAAVSLSLAIAGAGPYSFVAGMLAQSVVVAVLVLRAARLPFRLGFDPAVSRRLLVFGVPLAAGLGVESVVLFSDSVIVGHVLGTAVLGYYLLAFNISSWVPGIVGTAVRYVSIPTFSRLAEGEAAAFNHGVRRALPLLVAFVLPVVAVLVTLSPALVEVLYGAHWVPAAAALRFLAFAMLARMITGLVFDVQTGLGNTRVTIGLNLVWGVFLLPALWIGAHAGGIEGAAIGHALVAVVVVIPLAGWLLHRSGVDMRPVCRETLRPALAAVAAGVTMAALARPISTPFLELVVAGGLGVLAYVLLALPREHRVAAWHRATRWVRTRGPARHGAPS